MFRVGIHSMTLHGLVGTADASPVLPVPRRA